MKDKSTVIIFADERQRRNYIDEEYQDWLQYWKQRFEKEIEETDNEEDRSVTSE